MVGVEAGEDVEAPRERLHEVGSGSTSRHPPRAPCRTCACALAASELILQNPARRTRCRARRASTRTCSRCTGTGVEDLVVREVRVHAVHPRLLAEGRAHVLDRPPYGGRQPVAPLTHDRVEAVGRGRDEVGEAGACQDVPELLVPGVRPAQGEIATDGVVEQVTVLRDHADRLTQRPEGQVTDVDAGEANGAAIDVVRARDERGDRRFACTGGPDERHHLAGLDAEGHVCTTSAPPRSSSLTTSSSDARDTLSAAG